MVMPVAISIGYYDGSDIARPYLVDYSTGSPVYTYFDKEEYYPPSNHHKRGATSHKDHLWPLGIIPFSMDANFSGTYINMHRLNMTVQSNVQ